MGFKWPIDTNLRIQVHRLYEVGAFSSDIADFEHDVFEGLPLVGEIPLLDIGRVHVRVHDLHEREQRKGICPRHLLCRLTREGAATAKGISKTAARYDATFYEVGNGRVDD